MFTKKSPAPLTILVTESRWDALGDPTSLHHMFLMELLKKQGGISDTVPPGAYEYDAVREGLHYRVSLLPK